MRSKEIQLLPELKSILGRLGAESSDLNEMFRCARLLAGTEHKGVKNNVVYVPLEFWVSRSTPRAALRLAAA